MAGFIDKLLTDDDKVVLTKLLESCYEYSVAMNSQAQTHPFPSESLIIALLLTQHKVINYLKSVIASKQPVIEDDQRYKYIHNDFGKTKSFRLRVIISSNFKVKLIWFCVVLDRC